MNRLSLRQKLWLPLVLSWLGLLILTFWHAQQARDLQLTERRHDLSDVVDMSYSIIDGYQKRVDAGELTLAAAQHEAQARIADQRYGKDGYVTIVGADSVVIMHPMNPKLDGKNMWEFHDPNGVFLYQKMAATGSSPAAGGYIEYAWPKPGETNASSKLSYMRRFKPWNWDLIAGVYQDDIQAEYYATLLRSLGVLVLLGLLLSVVASFVVRSIRSSVGGEPAAAADLARRIASGDLTGTIAVVPGDQSSVVAAIAHTRDQLADTVGRIQAAARSITHATDEIASGNANLSSRTEQQAASLQETAAAMNQLTSTVKQNADNAQQATKLALDASEKAVHGGSVVGDVVANMRTITDSSKKVAEITSVIDGIAFQTNILALNAAVEAARAGEHGRGFAVVASEVRVLAQRSGSAAKEIRALIATSVQQIENGSTLAEDAGQTMQNIVSAVKRVTDIMEEIAAASNEQSTGIEEVSRAVTQMDDVTQQNAALVEQAAAAAGSLKDQAAELEASMAIFRTTASSHAAPRPEVSRRAAAAAAERRRHG
jgi:methyl-accepting chemotaxis protein